MPEVIECEGRHGKFRLPADTYIGAALATYGEYSEQEVALLVSLLKPGDIVVEVGAHVGTITVPLAKAVSPNGAVDAFEPQREMYQHLMHNVYWNDLDSVVSCHPQALADRRSRFSYEPCPANTGGVELKAGRSVIGLALDRHAAKLERLDLLKIDVEGMEIAVLAGARETIVRCRPMISVENDRPLNTQRLLDALFGFGYRVWRHEPTLFNPDNWKGVAHNLWPGVAALNLIALPEDADVPEAVKTLTEIKPDQWCTVCRFGGVGDNLIAAAPLSGLKRQGFRVEVISNKLAGEVFRNNPFVDKLSICEDKDQPEGCGFEWHQWFQKRGHEVGGRLYHLSHTVETTLAFVQGQSQFWWPPNVRRNIANVSYLEMAASICSSGGDFQQLFFPAAAEWAKATRTKEKLGKRLIAWVIGGSRFDKVHPYSAMAVARLIKETGVPVFLFGKPGRDHEIAKAIERDVAKQNGSTEGLYLAMTVQKSDKGEACDWPIRRALTQVLTCDLVITPDTGLAWAAAMAPMPKIVLLSHASPTNITKHWRYTVALHADQKKVPCWPCHRLHDTFDTCVLNEDKTGASCISDISVELICRTAKYLLDGGQRTADNPQVTWS